MQKRIVADEFQYFFAAESGHRQVEHDQIRHKGMKAFQCLQAVWCASDVIARLLKTLLVNQTHNRIVFGVKNGFSFGGQSFLWIRVVCKTQAISSRSEEHTSELQSLRHLVC